jgi:hypothetical protein
MRIKRCHLYTTHDSPFTIDRLSHHRDEERPVQRWRGDVPGVRDGHGDEEARGAHHVDRGAGLERLRSYAERTRSL